MRGQAGEASDIQHQGSANAFPSHRPHQNLCAHQLRTLRQVTDFQEPQCLMAQMWVRSSSYLMELLSLTLEALRTAPGERKCEVPAASPGPGFLRSSCPTHRTTEEMERSQVSGCPGQDLAWRDHRVPSSGAGGLLGSPPHLLPLLLLLLRTRLAWL